jgi:hypothetical protein
MDKEEYYQYVKDFNGGDYRGFVAKYFAKDAYFENPDTKHKGHEDISDFFYSSHKGVRETLRVENLLIGENKIAAELEAKMEVTADRPDYPLRPCKKGEAFIINIAAFYDVKDGKLSAVRVYRKKVTVL